MPRGVYDRSKSKTEGPKAPKAAAAKPAKTGPVARKQVAKQVAKATVGVQKSSGRTDQFASLIQSIATLASVNPSFYKNAQARAEVELIAQLEVLTNLRVATFGRSATEQAAYDQEQAQERAQREAAKAQARATQPAQVEEVPLQTAPNNGSVPMPAKPIMPVPPTPTA